MPVEPLSLFISSVASPLIDKLLNAWSDTNLKKDIEKAFNDTYSKSEYNHILDALSFDENFTKTISQIGEGKIIDCNRLVDLALEISKTKNLKLNKPQITDALKTFSLDLLNLFAAKNAELGKIPIGIQNFYNSMDRLSSMPDCFAELMEEKIKNAGYLDLEAKLKESEIKYKELQASIAKRDKEDNITEEIKKSLNVCNFGEAEKLLLQSLNKNLEYTEKAAQDAFQLAKLKHMQIEYIEAKEYYEQAVKLSPENSLYLNNLGSMLKELGEYNKAVEYYNNALNIDLKTFGDNHPKIAIRYNNLGVAWKKLGEYNKAIEYFENALNINLKTFGDNHPKIAIRYNNLGVAWKKLGEYNKAINYYNKALNIDLKTFGDNHTKIAIRYNNLGAAWYSLCEYEKAIKYYQNALNIDLKAFGDNHPKIAIRYNNLGAAFNSLGEHNNAIDYFNKALEIDLKIFGDNHPNTATTFNNLGGAFNSLCDYNNAINYYKKALEIDLNTLGNNHPNTARDFNNLGGAFNSSGEYKKAIEYYQNALNIDLKAFGDNHPNTARDFNNIGGAFNSSGEYKKAIEYYQKTLNIDLKTLGDNHPKIAIRFNNLGSAFNSLGDYNKAIEYYQNALNINLKAFGKNHTNTAVCYNNLGSAFNSLGDYNKAVEYFENALAINIKAFGNNHTNTAICFNNLGSALKVSGKYQEAIKYYKKALNINLNTLGDNHPDTVAYYNNLGAAFNSSGNYKEAAKYYKKAEKINIKAFKGSSPNVDTSFNNLGAARHLLIEHLLKKRWAIQVIQNTLSLHAHVPIRLLDKKRIPTHIKKLTIAEITPSIAKDLKKRKNSLWITLPSNTNPMIGYLRKNTDEWIAWENSFIGELLKNAKGNKTIVEQYYNDNINIAAYPIKIDKYFDGFLIIGPCFKEPGDNSYETFYKKIVSDFVLNVIKKLPKNNEAFAHNPDQLALLGASKSWIKKEQLKEKAELLGKTIESIFKIESDISIDSNLQRCTYGYISQTIFLINKDKPSRIISELFEHTKEKPIYFELIQRNLNHILALKKDNSLELINYNKKIKRKVFFDGYVKKQNKKADNILSDIEERLRELGVAYGALYQGYTGNKLKRFWNWLTDKFGLISQNEEKMYRLIAKEIAQLFSADMTTIYTFNYPEKKLASKTTYFQSIPADKALKWEKALIDNMDKAAQDEELRKLSITYRCSEDKKYHFCRALFDNRADPENETILNLAKNNKYKPFKSCMALTMIVNNRLFGVLEIAGLSPYQFRFANLLLACDICDMLGSFLYQKELMSVLNKLAETTLNQDKDENEKYKSICEQFAYIFFADASSLYIPVKGKSGEYRIAASNNRADLGNDKAEFSKFILKKEHKDSPMIKAINDKKPFFYEQHKKMGSGTPGWNTKLPQRKFPSEKFDWFLAVPVRNSNKDKIVCGLYLYYKNHPENFELTPITDKQLETIVEFMSDFAALLVSVTQSDQEKIERIQDILRHELKQTVDSISGSAAGILDIVRYEIKDSDILGSIYLKYKNLRSFRKSLLNIAQMLKGKNFKEVIEKGLDPIIYLINEQYKDINLQKDAEPINIKNMFNDIWRSQENIYRHKKIKYFYRDGSEKGISINVNRMVFHRILQNLLINAAKYSINETEIKAYTNTTGNSIKIHITNMAKCLQYKGEADSLFNESFRGSNSDANIEGSGLGLSIARKLCEHIGGSLNLQITKEQRDCKFDFIVILPKIIQK